MGAIVLRGGKTRGDVVLLGVVPGRYQPRHRHYETRDIDVSIQDHKCLVYVSWETSRCMK